MSCEGQGIFSLEFFIWVPTCPSFSVFPWLVGMGLWWPGAPVKGLGGPGQGVGGPHLHFSSVLLCGCADKHLTSRTGKGAAARFLSYCLSLLRIQENLLATEALHTTSEQDGSLLILLVFGIIISEMEIRHARCLEKCVLV